MKKKIVVIEDDQAILDLVIYNLQKNGFLTEGFTSGYDGLNFLLRNPSDLLILDLMLPDIDGFELCKELKSQVKTKNLPIIILTAKTEEADRVLGLELGADDYIIKPFSPRELVARVKAVLRRSESIESEQVELYKFEDLVVDTNKHKVYFKQQEIELTATEFSILLALIKHPGRVYTRNNLLDFLDKTILDRNIDVHITKLRKKLGPAGRFIKTIRGVGYKLDAE